VLLTDLNFLFHAPSLDTQKCIHVTSEEVQTSHHFYRNLPLEGFIEGLIASKPKPSMRSIPASLRWNEEALRLNINEPLRVNRMMKVINGYLDKNSIIIAEVGDSLFAATELQIRDKTKYISPAYYASLGFAVPATLGACVAKPSHRVVAICGDGGFQTTGQELSTIIRHGYNPIVIVLDNHGYGVQRQLAEGEWEFNEILPWKYHKVPEIYGGGKGCSVKTEGEFAKALAEAWTDTSCAQIIEAKLAEGDASRALLQLAKRGDKCNDDDENRSLVTKAYVCNKVGEDLKLQDITLPPLKATMVEIDMKCCGLCHTDVHMKGTNGIRIALVDFALSLSHQKTHTIRLLPYVQTMTSASPISPWCLDTKALALSAKLGVPSVVSKSATR